MRCDPDATSTRDTDMERDDMQFLLGDLEGFMMQEPISVL